MAALTNSRNTPELADGGRMQAYPVEANTTVFLGSMVALDTAGNAVPAASVPGLKILGRAERLQNGIPGQDAVNLPNGPIAQATGAAGSIAIVARRGVFMYAVNDGSIGEAQIGQMAYAVDDNSVSASDGSGATAVVAQPATFPVAASAQLINLGHENVAAVKVHSTAAGGTVFTEGIDYVVGYGAGVVMLIAGGAIPSAAAAFIDYSWGAPTRSVAGRIVNLDPSGQVWIDFWHQSASAV